ncbi:hypothetical protein L2C91_07220 [Rosenbergiella epipactidis]|uniref:hypothetical protein n=1 Tax=Rosenbergiella epipactidis TaxID=1544694 RepID=UPI002026E194|nr:hypothetical protein [Rosenbergiella epipactidis]MCL9668164.1 hypothetical protein [Rosenbergiella epipactidis]
MTAQEQLIAADEATVTLSVTGKVSARSVSPVIKVTVAPKDSDLVIIKNNLSEIADADGEAQVESRQ